MTFFVLIDCNNFYVSCERLFNPRLDNRPMIVLSNNDGCVISRSQEAKQLGIPMGVPFFKIKDFCQQQNIVVYSSNFQLYGDISQRVMEVLSSMTVEMQVYSIDEAFLLYPENIKGEERVDLCKEIRKKVLSWVGIPTSLGIGPSKTLAKAATKMAKQNRSEGVFDLSSSASQNRVLETFPIEEVWGIGRKSAAQLKARSIHTAKKFREMDPLFIRSQMGVGGERLLWELRGVSCLSFDEPSYNKSITCSRSFGRALSTEEELFEALATHTASACEKLRQQTCCAQGLYVYLEAQIFAGKRQHYGTGFSLPLPVNTTSFLLPYARKGLSQLFRKELRYKKCGVVLLDLIPEDEILPDLFLQGPDPKHKRADDLVDSINRALGKQSLFYGSMGVNPEWKMRSANRSPCYTTCWEELLIAKAS